jgi:hypothetical protein
MEHLGSTGFRIRKAVRDNTEYLKGIEEGENRVLYLLLCIGDENVAHDNWHPDIAELLLQTRRKIVERLKYDAPHFPAIGGPWPGTYPDFEKYTYTPG